MSAARPDDGNPDSGSPYFRDSLEWYLKTGAFWFATSFKWFILFLLLPLQVRELVPGGTANSSWGMVVSLGAIEAMFGPAIFGGLSDKTRSKFGRRRPYILVGGVLTAFALLFLGQANSLAAMIVGYLLLQITDDIGTGPYASLVPDLVPEDRRGRASGILSLLQLVAQIVAAVVGIVLAKSLMTIYLVIAALNILCAWIVVATVKETISEAPRAVEPGDSVSFWEGWISPWRSADFRWVWFTRALVALGFYLISNYAVNYMADVVGKVPGGGAPVFYLGSFAIKDKLQAAIAVVLGMSLAGALVTPWAGKLTDTLGRKRVIEVSGWIMFAALVPFALIPNYTLVFCLGLVFGAAYGAYLSASWALVSDILPAKSDSAKDMGIWQASVSTPQIVSGIAGFIIDSANKGRPGLGYTIGFLLSATCFLLGCQLVKRVRGSR